MFSFKEVQGAKAQFLAEEFKGLFITEKKEGTDTEIAKVLETRGNEVYLEQVHPQTTAISHDPCLPASRSGSSQVNQTGRRNYSFESRRTISYAPLNPLGSTVRKISFSRRWMSSSTNVKN